MNAIGILVAQHRAIEALFEESAQETRRRARSNAVSRLAEELIAHMAAEEAVFYPAVRAVADEAEEGAGDRGRGSHLTLRIELRRVLETSVGAPSFPARLDLLRRLFAQHVRDEELTLFPAVTAGSSDAELEALGAEILSSRPPVWIVTSEAEAAEGRSLVLSGGNWALRSGVTLPTPPPSD